MFSFLIVRRIRNVQGLVGPMGPMGLMGPGLMGRVGSPGSLAQLCPPHFTFFLQSGVMAYTKCINSPNHRTNTNEPSVRVMTLVTFGHTLIAKQHETFY